MEVRWRVASVCIDEAGKGRFRVRWRESVGKEGTRNKWRNRNRTVTGRSAAIELQAQVLRSLETRGFFADLVAPVGIAMSADPEEAAVAYLRERAADGDADNSIERWCYGLQRWFRFLRTREHVSDEDALDVGMFSRAAITAAKEAWRGEIQANTVRLTIGVVLDLWNWMADQPEQWPAVPMPPRRRKGLMPKAPPAVAPPAPTLAEIDAVLRQLAGDGRRNITLRACIIARYTGLRVSQVLHLKRADLDVERRTLYVATGKTARDKIGRIVPVSHGLIDELAPVLGRPPEASLFRRKDTQHETKRAAIPYGPLTRAWECAVTAGEVREEVWAPLRRGNKRPHHAFRAAFMAALQRLGVTESDMQRLVGHANTTSAKHYVDDASLDDALRAAVDKLPPIDWRS